MRLVRFGRNGPGASEIRLGSKGMSSGYEHAAEAIATIHAALEAGITMLDIGGFVRREIRADGCGSAGIGLQREPLVGRSPRIHGELLKLGFELAESTVQIHDP